MKKRAASVLAMTAIIIGSPANAADFPQMAPQPNMAGIRYCPAPDCDNAEFLDTYYSIDAKTGKLTAHTAGGDVAADNSHLDTGEVMVMAMPNINPESRFVPPEQAFGSSNAYAASTLPALPGTQVVLPTASGPDGALYIDGEMYDNNRVPWWKGGLWRNRKRGDQGGGDNTVEARELPAGSSRGSSTRSSRTVDDDEMWDDDDDFSSDYDDESSSGFSPINSSTRSKGGYDEFDDEDPYSSPQFGRDRDGGDMNGDRRGQQVGGGGAGGRDTYAADRPGGGLPIPPGGGRDMDDDDDFDNPFGGGASGGMGGGGFGGGAGMGGGMGMGGGGSIGVGGGGMSGGGMGGGGYSDPVSATATVYSDQGSGGSFGDVYSSGSTGGSYSSDPYSSGSYSSGSYSDSYSSPASSFDSSYIDTSIYAQPSTVTESVVQSSNDGGTASFLDGSPYSSLNYTPPTIESLTGDYTSGSSYGGAYSPGSYSSGGYDAPAYGGGQSFGGGGGAFGGYGPGPDSDPFGAVPNAPSYQGVPSPDAQGSPQFENAVRLVKENRFSEAKNILSSETNRNPSNASAWRWLADCYYNLLELDDAINSYQRALERDPNDYYALRGQGFAYLHRGHEYWRRMQEEVARGEKDAAATTFAHAHDNYKKSLELLGLCLRRAPNDGEATYGEAMAAEGASRKLYSNAISYLKLGPEHRERAELFAENCLTVINKGVERARERARQNPGDAGPRALLGGLYLRKAILYNQLGKNDLALTELRNSRDVQQSILDEIDKNNATARKNIREAEIYWDRWGGNRN